MTTESQSTTTKLEASEPTLEPCRWCAEGDTPKFLDRDGTLVSITGNEGVLSHAHEEYWWPCLKFGVEIRCARVSANGVPTVDREKQARDLVDAFRFASPPVQSLRFLEWEPLVSSIACALTTAASPVAPQQSVIDRLNEDRCMFCGGKTTHKPDCDHGVTTPAPSAAIQNESRAEELTRQQIVQAITDIQEARESHVKWANHLRNENHGLCEGCDNFAAHIGNADYHDEWIAKYDNVIAVLARTPFAARDLPNAPEVDPNRKCWASTTKEICTDPRGCDERGCQRYTDEDYRSKFNQPTSRDIRAELITAHNAMPRRRCSVHKREEFKYESLEHELHAAAAESSYSEGVDDAARVSGVLNKVEQSNLSSLARKAAGEIFEFGKYDLEPERAKDQITAIIERCLSEGEA